MKIASIRTCKACFWGIFFLILIGCNGKSTTYNPDYGDASLIHRLNDQLTESIVQDGFSPPVASRIYAYTNIAAYECARLGDSLLISFSGQLNGLGELPSFEVGKDLDLEIAALTAYCDVAIHMVYRDYLIEEVRTQILEEKIASVPGSVIQRSKEFGSRVAEAINSWSDTDGYKETRAMPLYQPSREPGHWVPTPPTYANAIEPNWMQIRPFVLDSAGQFRPPGPASFSTDKGSSFYSLAMEVFEAVNNLDSSQLEVAKFWDCNPFVSINRGHLMYAKRQLTPGGHWMGIAATASKKEGLSLPRTTEIMSLTAIGLADAFISCWEEKYRSDLIRPETYINKHIDPAWRPILETPMFPEHTSGHSAISGSAATILTAYFGEPFLYTDSVNVPFGLPSRKFQSFFEASDEAARSRLYGGIHYMPSIEYGKDQGKAIGRYIHGKLKTRKSGS
jgi:hypothetical protein